MGRLMHNNWATFYEFVDIDHRDSEGSDCDCFSCHFFREEADVERQACVDYYNDLCYDEPEGDAYNQSPANGQVEDRARDSRSGNNTGSDFEGSAANDSDGNGSSDDDHGYESDFSSRSFKHFLCSKMEHHLEQPYIDPPVAIENSFITMNTLKSILSEYESTHPTQNRRHWEKFLRFYREAIYCPIQDLVVKMKEAYDMADAFEPRFSASTTLE